MRRAPRGERRPRPGHAHSGLRDGYDVRVVRPGRRSGASDAHVARGLRRRQLERRRTGSPVLRLSDTAVRGHEAAELPPRSRVRIRQLRAAEPGRTGPRRLAVQSASRLHADHHARARQCLDRRARAALRILRGDPMARRRPVDGTVRHGRVRWRRRLRLLLRAEAATVQRRALAVSLYQHGDRSDGLLLHPRPAREFAGGVRAGAGDRHEWFRRAA